MRESTKIVIGTVPIVLLMLLPSASALHLTGGPAAVAPEASRAPAVPVGSAELAAARSSLAATGSSLRPPPVAPLGHPATSPSPTWEEINGTLPAGSLAGSMVWDASAHKDVYFGGETSAGLAGTTWTVSPSGVWTPLQIVKAPAARYLAAMAYDAADSEVLLFGGLNFTSYFSDTWTFSNGKWTELTPVTHPTASYGASMTYDPALGHVLLFGGNTSTGTLLNTTWEFAGGVWTKLSPTTSPSPRFGAAFDFDPATNYPVLFGGYGPKGSVLSDTWNFSAGSWHLRAPPSKPGPRAFAALAYSPADAGLVLFGGHTAYGPPTFSPQTWLWANGTWTKVAVVSPSAPSARGYLVAADGSSTMNLTIFGGYSWRFWGDAWSYAKGAWTPVRPAVPAGRAGAAMAWDAADGYVVMFGGVNGSTGTVYGDTWKFVHGVWSPLKEAVAPPAVYLAMMTYDAADGYVLLFGGWTGATSDCGSWAFAHGAWSEVVRSCYAGPTPRYGAAMAFDATDGYVLLFGGQNATSGEVFGDTWSYSAGAWSNLTAVVAGAPPATVAGASSYDSYDGGVLLFGGIAFTGSYGYNSVYSYFYSGGTWYNVSYATSLTPSTVEFAVMVDDPATSNVVMFGGDDPYIGVVGFLDNYSAFEYAKPIAFGYAPPALDEAAGAYDPLDGYVLVFGGITSTGAFLGDSWGLSNA